MQRRYANPLQCLLLWLSLFLLTPAAQAHEGHDQQHDDLHSELARAVDLSAFTLPCGGHGGGHCHCASACSASPDLTKLPAVPQTRFFLPIPRQRLLPEFCRGSYRTTSPIVAFAAPRAPPLPL